MKNLYANEPEKIDDLVKSIKDTISNPSCSKYFSNKINKLVNIKTYRIHRNCEKICKTVNSMYGCYSEYLDCTNEKNFLKTFQREYGQKVFELVMASFLDQNGFHLEAHAKKEGLPDLYFNKDGKQYILECTSRSATIMSKFMESRNKFDDYFVTASILSASAKHKNITLWYSKDIINHNIWPTLTEREKLAILKAMDCCTASTKICNNHLDILSEWVLVHNAIRTQYSELLPEEWFNKLHQNTVIPNILVSTNFLSFKKTLAKFLAQCIFSKLEKQYCSGDVPVVLAISLSMLDDVKMIQGADNLTKVIVSCLPEAMNIVFNEKLNNCCEPKDTIEQLKINIGNLYGIIIDTSWYNWFPGLVGSFPSEYNNCYAMVYNTNLSDKMRRTANEKIFDSIIPYSYELDFKMP